MNKVLRQMWSQSRAYRVILIAALIYALLRLAVHGVYLGMMMAPGQSLAGERPDWVGTQEPMIPDDLRIYLDAAGRLRLRQNLYLQGTPDRMEFYQYAPSFALVLTSVLWLPRTVVAILHTLLNMAAYVLLYIQWGRIFSRFHLAAGTRVLAQVLPVWVAFSAFWSDLSYLNVYILLALLSTLAIDAVLNQQLGRALLWISIILQIKPQWAFALAIPLLMGQYRFFFKLVLWSVVTYAVITAVTLCVIGPTYGWQQMTDYARLVWTIRGNNYPWRGPEAPFLGYNHSIKQIVVYLIGATPRAFRLASLIKILILLPLGIIGIRYLSHPAGRTQRGNQRLGLDLAFALYTGAFIWLDVIWEYSLGIAVFTYLLATADKKARILIWVAFLPYALVDLFQIAGFIMFGSDAILPGLYVLTDPSIYVPVVMIAALAFYALLIKRLFSSYNDYRACSS